MVPGTGATGGVGIGGTRWASPTCRAHPATYLHRIAECVNLAMAEEYFFGDPAFVDVPVDYLLDPATISRRARCATTARSRELLRRGTNLPHMASTADLPKVEADTSYCCVVDRWGNAFSATPSDGSGNVPGGAPTGITPSGRGSQSRPDPRHPAGVAPGKRPRLDAESGDGGGHGMASCRSAHRAARTCRPRRWW